MDQQKSHPNAVAMRNLPMGMIPLALTMMTSALPSPRWAVGATPEGARSHRHDRQAWNQ